jgi:transposase
MLQALMNQVEFLEKMINKFDKRIGELTRPFKKAIALLDTIPGIDIITAQSIIAEIGIDMAQFPSAKNLASWAGMCPGNDESAGKRKNCKTPKGNISLHRVLSEAAWAASISKNTYLKALYLRLVPRKGKKKAIAVLKHALLVIIYNVLKNKVPYSELGPDYFLKLNKNGLKRYHVKRLEKLGFKVSLEASENVA